MEKHFVFLKYAIYDFSYVVIFSPILKCNRHYKKLKRNDENHFLSLESSNYDEITICDYFTPGERLEQILLHGLRSFGLVDRSGPRLSDPPGSLFNKFLTFGIYDPRLFLLIGVFLR